MRTNEPITQHEIELPDGEPLVSRTDTNGAITFANRVFVAVSGFTEQELIGAPHNIVRHPSMPSAAFANLWETIKSGLPWDGLVKNRARSGDFYWVRANVTPVIENERVTGYISIRSKPTRAQIAKAEQAYAAIRDGRATNVRLRAGELVTSGWRSAVADVACSIVGRLATAMLAAVVVILAIGWLGLSGMAASNQVLQRVYEHDLVAVNQLRTGLDRIRDNRNHIAQLAVALGRGIRPEDALKEREPPVRANMAETAALWRAYETAALTPAQQALARALADQYAVLLRDVVEPAFEIARRGASAQLDTLFQKRAPPLFQAVFDTNRKLVELQIEQGREAYSASVVNLRLRLMLGIASGLCGLLLVLSLGWVLLRSVRLCVSEFEGHFKAIIRGEFDAEIPTPKAREFRPSIALLRAMRAHLAFGGWSRAEFERKTAGIRRETVDKMAVTIEQKAGSAVERVAQRTGAMAQDADAMAASAERVSINAEGVAGAADHAMKNAQIVAAASEQLAASIREVSAQVEHASTVSRGASGKGGEARETIGSLAVAAGRIGAVVRLIADIAARTNLLALNATIEAARAGEAGKGFAVVAGEVKSLAAQTAKATEEISQQIAALSNATAAAVTAVQDIGQTLEEVANVAMSVAAAIEQQTAATHEIARNVAESGSAVQEVTNRIGEVSREAAETGAQAGRLRVASGAVAAEIATLRGALVRTIRTATIDADRRLEPRIAVSEPCTVSFGSERGAGTVLNISEHGAYIAINHGGAAVGRQGTLALDRRAGAEARFEILAIDADGRVHVHFAENGVTAALQDVTRGLREGEARAAA